MEKNAIVRKQDVLSTRVASVTLGAAGAVQCAIGSFAIAAALSMDRIENWRIASYLFGPTGRLWALILAIRLLAGLWIAGCGILTWKGRPRAAYHALLPGALLLVMTLLSISDSWAYFQHAFRYGLALWALDAAALTWIATKGRAKGLKSLPAENR